MEQYINEDELYHYGVLGMKWGVHRALHKNDRNAALRRKALNKDKKAADVYKKAERAHSVYDLRRANLSAVKAGTYAKAAARNKKRALTATNELSRNYYEKRAAKKEYKSTKAKIKANRLSRLTGYGARAMRLAVKSDKLTAKAAKARLKLAKNELYISKMKTRINEIPESEINNSYEFVKRLKGI